MLIEAICVPACPEALLVAAETVRSALYTVDALGDRIRALAQAVRNR